MLQRPWVAPRFTVTPWTVAIQPNSIRSVDGAGVNEYGPSGAISQSIVISQNQSLSAVANVSLDSSSPLPGSVGVTNVSAGTYLGLPVLTFDVNAQGDALHLHNVTVNFTVSGGGAVGAAYLYNGSTVVMSAGTVTLVVLLATIVFVPLSPTFLMALLVL